MKEIMEKKQVHFSPPDISESEIEEVIATLRSGWITTGRRTKQFEKDLATFLGTSCVTAFSSQTCAAEMTLRILGIGPGDEVIVPAYTYTASAAIIHHVGAKIVMLDTAPDTFELDYSAIADAINERTKAIIPVDIGGKMCDYDKVFAAIESKKHLFSPSNELQKLFGRVVVVADSAHGLGASYKGRSNGTCADFTTFSFHAVKNLTTGEGGAVTWKDKEGLDNNWLYQTFTLYSLHGQNKDALTKSSPGNWRYDIKFPGYKCNMTDIQAAIGIKQLQRYPGMLIRRKEIIRRYDAAFLPYGIHRLVHEDAAGSSSGHLYLARIPGMDENGRDCLIDEMARRGVSCNVHFRPLPMMTAYKNLGFTIDDYPNAYNQYKNEISLPLHTRLTDDEVEYVICQFTDILKALE